MSTVHVHAHRLEAARDTVSGVGDGPGVLNIEHLGLEVVGIGPLRGEGIAHEFQRVGRGALARVGVEAAILVEVVVLVPEAALDLVIAKPPGQREPRRPERFMSYSVVRTEIGETSGSALAEVRTGSHRA